MQEAKVAADNQKQDIDPNKEFVLSSLTLGYHDFEKSLSRHEQEKRFLIDQRNPRVAKPDLLLHHDKAYQAKDYIRRTFERNNLSPNLRFDNIKPRDNKMYHLSDLSNLEEPKTDRSGDVNQIERYLALENVLPHQNTLARGHERQYYNVLQSRFNRNSESNSFSAIPRIQQPASGFTINNLNQR